MHRTRTLAVLLIVAGLLFAACGEGQADEPTIDQALMEKLTVGASELARSIIEDGDVTIDEVERSALAVRECLEEKGYEVVEFEFDPLGQRGGLVITAGSASQSAGASGDQALDECVALHYDPVTAAYAFLHPIDEAGIQRLRARFTDCVRDAGYEVSDFDSARSAVGSDADTRRSCLIYATS